MDGGARIGAVAGIPVRVHWSVGVVAWLLSWSLATVLLPERAPGGDPAAYWTAGLLAALALFASLLAHEVAHALTAKRAGLRVEGITLWLFGGVADLAEEAPDPRVEVRVAGIGPLVSLGLAALSGGGALALGAAGAPALVVSVLTWLAGINAVLAVFNLLPGAPLDGGRLLRAWLWRRHGDRDRATVDAGRAGRVLGLALVALGAVEVVVRADLGGLWTALIGWFLFGAAQAEISAAQTAKALAGVRVVDLMTPDPRTVPSWLPVAKFLTDHAPRSRFNTFPLIDFDGSVDGLLSVNDAVRVPASLRERVRVRSIATPPERLTTAGPGELVVDVLRGSRDRTARVLVVDDGRLVGIVFPGDVARAALLGRAQPVLTKDRELVAAGR